MEEKKLFMNIWVKRLLLVLLILGAVGGLVLHTIRHHERTLIATAEEEQADLERVERRFGWSYFEQKGDLTWIVHVERGTQNPDEVLFITDESSEPMLWQNYVPGKYLLLANGVGRTRTFSDFFQMIAIEYEVAELEFYDFITQEYIKTIDLLDFMERLELDPHEYRLMNIYPSIYVGLYNQLFFEWDIRINPTAEDYLEAWDYITARTRVMRWNYNTGRLSLYHRPRAEMSRRNRELMDTIESPHVNLTREEMERYWNIEDINIHRWSNFAQIHYRALGYVIVTFTTCDLPEECEEVYGRFPRLLEFREQEGLRVTLFIPTVPLND